ncbi:MAG: DUF4124 domain-containing protein [Rhodanobacteraceae bacterium]
MRRVLLAAVALTIATTVWAAGTTPKHNRYKWTDAEGNLHYSDALPAEAVRYGYEIVNAEGVVIKHVDRPKTADERRAAKAELAKAQAAKADAETRVRTDQQLLAAYPTEEDLKRAQRQQSEMLEQNLTSARISLQSQEKALSDLLGHAAELESTGKEVPAQLAGKISAARKQVEDQRSYIERKETERTDAVARFDVELAHYRDLKSKLASDTR